MKSQRVVYRKRILWSKNSRWVFWTTVSQKEMAYLNNDLEHYHRLSSLSLYSNPRERERERERERANFILISNFYQEWSIYMLYPSKYFCYQSIQIKLLKPKRFQSLYIYIYIYISKLFERKGYTTSKLFHQIYNDWNIFPHITLFSK